MIRRRGFRGALRVWAVGWIVRKYGPRSWEHRAEFFVLAIEFPASEHGQRTGTTRIPDGCFVNGFPRACGH